MGLKRLFDIKLKLATNCLTFRLHEEDINNDFSKNFSMMVNFLPKYDDVVRYSSSAIQNEIIQSLR